MSPTDKSQRIRAGLLLCITTLLWSTGGVLIKWISLPPLAIAGMRSAIAVPVLLLFYRRGNLTFSKAQIAASVFYAANVILFVVSTKMTTAANAIILQYTAPVYVALLSYFILSERIKKVDWIFIAVVLAGMCLFFGGKLSRGVYLGNVLAIVSGVFFALYIIYMRKQKDGHPIGSALLGIVITAVVLSPFMFKSMPDRSSWIGLILLGAFQLGLSHALYSIAVKRVTALESIMIPMTEPVLNPIWVFFFIGEVPSKWAIAGGVVVIMSVVWHSLMRLSKNSSDVSG